MIPTQEQIERKARQLAEESVIELLRSGQHADLGSPLELGIAGLRAIEKIWPQCMEEAKLRLEMGET